MNYMIKRFHIDSEYNDFEFQKIRTSKARERNRKKILELIASTSYHVEAIKYLVDFKRYEIGRATKKLKKLAIRAENKLLLSSTSKPRDAFLIIAMRL